MTHRYLLAAICISALIAGVARPVWAQDLSSPTEMSALFACQAEPDDEKRLRCFDDAAAALRAANASGELVAVTRAEVETVERDAFGFNLPSLPRLRGIFGSNNKSESGDSDITTPESEPLDRVTMPVGRWTKSNRGRYTFYLENGQIWTQTESDSLTRPRKGDDGRITVEIRKGLLGSYLLKVNGKGRSVRVRRTE